ncbi:MAG: hypothetical protein FGF48_11060, partial [Candidatus Brockarchaeota archaeon]|nr:hypothetical protein [Candidatus Brockarchaeota archaeon]
IPAIFELLKEDLQIIPGRQAEKSFGFNAFSLSNGKLSMDKGSLSIDGSVRLSDGMVLRLEDPSVRLVPNEKPFETGTINEMLLGGRIGGVSVIVSESGNVQAFHGGSYLPAVVTASSLGLQLGLLAKPSGGTLTITGESLLTRGISDLSLLNVVYPNGETSTAIYTGRSLQIPSLSYSSGAFVGVQAVETKVIWTGIDRREFYSQIASASEILSGILGKGFAEELVKTLLLSGLTDIQALDIANELVRNVEWLKGLSGDKRIELVKKIVEYVRKGETAEEAVERVKEESEKYAKNVEEEIWEFYFSIPDTQLASEALSLLKCVKDNLGADAAEWLLAILARIRSQAGDAGLKTAMEKAFKYSESVTQGCSLASAIVSQLREKSIEQAWEELSRIVNYPEGLKIEGCKLREHGDNLRIKVGKERLEPYLGNEPCWVKVKVKRRTLYKRYDGEKLDFDLPKDMEVTEDEIKNGIEVTIIKITTYEFVSDVLEGSGRLFRIAFKSGKYMLIVDGKEVCELFMKEDLHYDGTGDYGPAVIFAIKDSEEKEHLIKLAYRKSEEYLVRVKIGASFRRVESAKYDGDMCMLRIEYHKEGRIFRHEVFLESPKAVLIRMVKKVRDLLNEGVLRDDPKVTRPVGRIGWYYTRFYREEDIKEIVSKVTGIPKEELRVVQGYETEGPDFYVYHKEELVAIVEVKTTTVSDRYPKKCLEDAVEGLKGYITSDYKGVELGIPIIVYLKDLDRIIETEFKEGVELIVRGITKDEFEGKEVEDIVEEILQSLGQP